MQIEYKKIKSYIISFIFLISLIIELVSAERLPSYLYSIPYHNVENKIINPKTHRGLYPDTLDWSQGGQVKFGLQALIACNKKNKEYLVSEIIGIRSGIKNVSDSTIQLWFAFYSPNKHGIPPDYTLFIDGPYNYPRIIGYLGDDLLFAGHKKRLENMVSIPTGRIFNPSPDSLFYNASDGLFNFEAPGNYKLWFVYSIDSMTSNLSIPLTLVCSDTFELKVIKPDLIDTSDLVKLLPKKLRGFKSSKPGKRYFDLNPYWKESTRYPEVWRSFFARVKGGDSLIVGINIIDTGQMPAAMDRHSLCKQKDKAMTTMKGFPACKHIWDIRERTLVHEAINVIIGNRIIVKIQGRGVGMEKIEKIANLINYSAIVKAIKD